MRLPKSLLAQQNSKLDASDPTLPRNLRWGLVFPFSTIREIRLSVSANLSIFAEGYFAAPPAGDGSSERIRWKHWIKAWSWVSSRNSRPSCQQCTKQLRWGAHRSRGMKFYPSSVMRKAVEQKAACRCKHFFSNKEDVVTAVAGLWSWDLWAFVGSTKMIDNTIASRRISW